MPRGAGRADGEDLGQAFGIHHGLHGGVGQQALEFGGKDQAGALLPVEQRLDAEVVPRQDEALGRFVPDGEGKDAVEPPGGLLSPGQVGGQHHLRVGAGGEGVAQGLQLPAQFRRVVELAVVRQDHGAAAPLPHHGLDAPGRVDDDQPPLADGRVAGDPVAVLVRAAAREGAGHGFKYRRFLAQIPFPVDPSRDAAHGLRPPSSGGGGIAGRLPIGAAAHPRPSGPRSTGTPLDPGRSAHPGPAPCLGLELPSQLPGFPRQGPGSPGRAGRALGGRAGAGAHPAAWAIVRRLPWAVPVRPEPHLRRSPVQGRTRRRPARQGRGRRCSFERFQPASSRQGMVRGGSGRDR